MVLMNLFSGKQWRNRHREQIYGHGVGEEEEGETYGENNMETYISICKTDSQREFFSCPRKLKQGLCINLDRRNVGRWEGVSKARGYMYTYV